jgi:2-desacetyl-2-hydroxyethyl bacteriochlorophyllide A dehydrogenase
MPSWLLQLLAKIYTALPPGIRPPLKRVFLWGTLRLEGLFSSRGVRKGNRVEFIDFEIAHLEPYEFLSPRPNEVEVRVERTLVSPGTERAVLCGLPGARKAFPYVPGYSAAGTVVKAGAAAGGLKPGDRVAGRVKHASTETVPAAVLFRIPTGVSSRAASFIELGIITLQGIRKAAIRPGERVIVIGQGLIGQLANRLARVAGASEVIAMAPSRKRERTALAGRGAHRFVVLDKGATAVDGIQADVVIEAVGLPDAVTTALRAARPGGRVILLGSSRGLSRNVDMWRYAQQRDVTVVGAHVSDMPDRDASAGRWTYRQEGEVFLNLLAARRLEVEDLVTWDARPEECNAVFELLAKGGGDQVAIGFDWSRAV